MCKPDGTLPALTEPSLWFLGISQQISFKVAILLHSKCNGQFRGASTKNSNGGQRWRKVLKSGGRGAGGRQLVIQVLSLLMDHVLLIFQPKSGGGGGKFAPLPPWPPWFHRLFWGSSPTKKPSHKMERLHWIDSVKKKWSLKLDSSYFVEIRPGRNASI